MQRILQAVPIESDKPGVTLQSLHDILEFGCADARFLGNPIFSSSQRAEKFHKQAKLAVVHHNPMLPLGNSVLSQGADRLLLDYEANGGHWHPDGTLECKWRTAGLASPFTVYALQSFLVCCVIQSSCINCLETLCFNSKQEAGDCDRTALIHTGARICIFHLYCMFTWPCLLWQMLDESVVRAMCEVYDTYGLLPELDDDKANVDVQLP